MSFFKKQEPAEDLANLKVTDARTGDVISISGAGQDYKDLDFTADRTTRYQSGARRWFEVSGMYMERRVALRVYVGEEVAVHLHADARQLSLEDLGLSEDDLAEIDQRQNTADSFQFDNRMWLYRLSREATAARDDLAQPTGYYYWEFQEQAGRGLLAVRKPEAEPFAVTLYDGIPASDVTIYRPAGR
jgi:hypothetical protein